MNYLKQGGRILFSIPFIIFGSGHLMNADAMSGMVPIPGIGTLVVYLTGVCLILAGISLLIQRKVYLSMLLLGVFMVLTSLMIHMPVMMQAVDEMAQTTSMSNLMKDMALAGACFFISGTFKS